MNQYTKNTQSASLYATRKLHEEELDKLAAAVAELFAAKKMRGYCVPATALNQNVVFRAVGVGATKFHIEAHPFKHGESSVVFDFSGYAGGVEQFEKDAGLSLAGFGRAFSGYGSVYSA